MVLLHAYAGSGKTTTAAEFARWYTLTGGLEGPVPSSTSFEQYKPLERGLDSFGQMFNREYGAGGLQLARTRMTPSAARAALIPGDAANPVAVDLG